MVKCLRLSLLDQEHANSIHCTGASQTAHLGKGKKKKDVRLERIKASFADMIFADDCIHIQSKIT